MTKYELNQLDVRNDGRIILYQRPRKDGSIIPTWQMRISVPNSTGYHIQSTAEKDLSEATRRALNKYEELALKVLAGGALQSKSFKKVYEAWKEDLPLLTTDRSDGYVEHQLSLVRTYPLKFFSGRRVDNLRKGDFSDYWMWRRENSAKVNPMTGKSVPYFPSNNSLRRESVALRNMFSYAVDKGWMTGIPEMNIPSLEKNRRPSFTVGEWRLLTRRMREWVKEGQKWGSVGRDRFLSQQYVLILANCGARIGEVRGLRWSDLSTQVDGDSKRLMALVNGKTGEREIVFQAGSEAYVKRVYDLRKSELDNDPPYDGHVFCTTDGKPIGSFRKGFDSMLRFCELSYDAKGDKRSLYSLRHFYATQRLSEEVSPFLLARQMGTSVEMLERFYGHVVTSLVAKEITKTKGHVGPQKVGDMGYPFDPPEARDLL
jgi:integrase